MSNTSLLLSSDGPIMFMSGPPEARSAIGSIMVWLILISWLLLLVRNGLDVMLESYPWFFCVHFELHEVARKLHA